MMENLSRLGCEITEEDNSLIIGGRKNKFKKAALDSFQDHRIAMSMAIASLLATGDCKISNVDCVDTSYPSFYSDLKKIT